MNGPSSHAEPGNLAHVGLLLGTLWARASPVGYSKVHEAKLGFLEQCRGADVAQTGHPAAMQLGARTSPAHINLAFHSCILSPPPWGGDGGGLLTYD